MTETHVWPDEERMPLTERVVLEQRLQASQRDVQAILKRYTALEKKLETLRVAHREYEAGRLTLDELEHELIDVLRVQG